MKKSIIVLIMACAGHVYGQSKIANDSLNTEFVPFGVTSKNALVASTSSVNGEKLRSMPATNLIQSLYGQLPGVFINQTTGEPGEENNELFIRGKASLLENIPMILVDGVETSYHQIHWSEVEKVTVLKDAASLAIYGLRGANGVLLINTVRGGVTGKPAVSFNMRYGSQKPMSLPQYASNADYLSLYNEARRNDGLDTVYTQERIDGFANNIDPYLYPNVNWQNEVLKSNAPVSDYSLTFKGGSKTVRYFLMLGYLNNQGFYAGTDSKRDKNSNINFDRYSFRSNIDVNVTNEFMVSLDISGRIFQKIQPNITVNDHWKSMQTFSTFPVYTPTGLWSGRQGEINNPKAAILEGGYKSLHSRELNETLRLHYDLSKILPGLGVFGNIAFSSWFETNYDKTKQYPYFEVALRPGTTPGAADVAYDLSMRNKYSDPVISQGSYWEWNRYNLEGGLDYKHNEKNHSFEGLLMYHQNLYRANGVHSPYAQQRIMGRIHYGFADRYFAELTGSYSGSDNYEKGKRFGFFPAAALAWVASNEDFLKNNDLITYLKVKASHGLVGSDRIGSTGRWGYQQYYSSGTGVTIGGETTSGLSNLLEGKLANPGLTWEKALKSNIALQTVLFNKLSVDLDLFYEKRTDILVPASGTRPSYVGITLPYVNEGITENKGYELAVQYKDKIADFEYWIGGNISSIKSNVINKNEEPRKDAYRSETGYPLGTIFGLEQIGFFKDEADIAASPTQLFGRNRPGDLKYKDMNEDGFVDDLDMKAIGKSTIPELIYAANAGVSFKGIDFSVLFQGVGERSVVLSGNAVKPFVDNAMITPWAASGRWTPATSETANYPRLSTMDNANNYRTSTFWLRDGSYIRLKNIELGYTLPTTVTKRVKIEKCRFFVNADNLKTWHQISDISVDPESFNVNVYPMVSTMNVGLNLSF
jgi:TonB-linked SusC/RagA family outer membrane protein